MPGPNPTNNYIGSFHFLVKVQGFETEMDGFMSCTGVKSVTEVFTFNHGIDTHVRQARGRTSFEPIILERAYSGLDEFAAWRDRIEDGADERKEIVIEYRTANKTPVARFLLQSAFPSRWESPDLSAMSSDAAVERIEISYERVMREFSGSHLAMSPPWYAKELPATRKKSVAPDPYGGDHSKGVKAAQAKWSNSQGPPRQHKPRQMNYPSWVLKY